MSITYLEIAIRLILAIILGGLIGIERELYKHEAGFRTNILVALGSTLITLTSIYAFDFNADPSRVAAGIITGIGFLGAGAIIQAKERVRGLTTAATLWLVAGVGLAIGAGFYFGAILTTVLALTLLYLGRNIKKRL